MADPFVAEIRLFPYDFAPTGWALCQGQLLPINQNTALFSLVGTYYGGNGTSNFALPDLRGRVPIHQGSGPGLSPVQIGEVSGDETVTLLQNEMPPHNHPMPALAHAATATVPAPGQMPAEGHGLGRGAYAVRTYAPSGAATTLVPASVTQAGNTLPHNNLQPYLTMNWCIALQGVFPPRS
jgi:microcystin-dependent protein